MSIRSSRRSFAHLFLALFLASGVVFIACLPGSLAAELSPAERRHVDRLAILTEEHKDLTRRMADAKARQPLDTEEIRELQASMDALNKEIAYVRAQPVYEDKSGLSEGKVVLPVRTAIPRQRLNPKPQGDMQYEDWDILKNFGTRKNNAESD